MKLQAAITINHKTYPKRKKLIENGYIAISAAVYLIFYYVESRR